MNKKANYYERRKADVRIVWNKISFHQQSRQQDKKKKKIHKQLSLQLSVILQITEIKNQQLPEHIFGWFYELNSGVSH